HKFRRIPVVEAGNKLVGIVSLGDIHKAIFKRELGLKD
ncbi:MAG: CBS domain-containing protein, partial [Magnetococcales bacterium]|nr:CBS domain-containing protein [Magnetococcales bacterium]